MKVARVIGQKTGRGNNLTITKTGGNGEEFEIPNPDYQKRNPMKHLTPKKKKRK